MKKFTYTLCLVFSLICIQLQAQILSKADKHFNSFAYQDAIELYEILWQKDSLNDYLVKQLAMSYRMLNNSTKTEEWYARVMKASDVQAEDYLHYARALQANEKYDQAKHYLERYAEFAKVNLNGIDLEYISELKGAERRYSIAPISINSEASDFGTAFYQNKIVFSSAKAKPSLIKRNYRWNEQNYLRLYTSDPLQNGDLKNADLLSNELGTNFHDGPVCFNETGDEMYLTRNFVSTSKRAKRNNDGVVSIQLYFSKKEGKKWSAPKLMSVNLEGYSTGHPSLSKDGKILYFISDRPGGVGGTDIYFSERKDDSWSEPVNAGGRVNTKENEMFPFVTENDILYFASKGHTGLGGLDIFWIDDLNNDKPVNLGSPINTSKDDFALILKNGKGYLSSNRVKGETFDDIYRFEILERVIKGQVLNSETDEILGFTRVSLLDENGNLVNEIETAEDGRFSFIIKEVQGFKLLSVKQQFTDGVGEVLAVDLKDQTEVYRKLYQAPDNTLQLDGLVVYRENRLPVEGVNVTLFKKGTSEPIDLITNDEGKVACILERDAEYTIEYQKDDILSKSGSINTYDIDEDHIYVEEKVDKVQVGKVFVLENIFYDLDKSNIRPDAAIELDKLVLIMNDNPTLKIELSSHTDSRGSDAYNMALSDKRAKSAVQYIIENGISKERIVAKGYGETKLINRCSNGVKCSKAEHQANRRTEVKVLEL
ncbi:MAG: OmpA family protein [Marinifilum sp.]|jgi:outer membrane protein OmpA-like peptidoglycan-associated protein|nr:OmpA family protein [Marinifilum sp.]